MNPQLSGLCLASNMAGDSPEDTALLQAMHKEAQTFILGFDWCKGIVESYFANGVGGVVAVFALKILPQDVTIDEWFWVIVGDIPPAYIVAKDNPTPAAALEAYIEEMTRWIKAVRAGESIRELIPVNTPPTKESASMLERRLLFLEREILPDLLH